MDTKLSPISFSERNKTRATTVKEYVKGNIKIL